MTSNDTAGRFVDHLVWEELAAGAALHALEADEQHLFDLHASDCAECQQLVDDNLLIAAQLGALSLPSDVIDDEEVPSWSAMRASIIGEPESVRGTAVVDLAAARDRRRLTRSRLLLGAAAAVVVVAGAGVGIWHGVDTRSACHGLADCHDIKLTSAGATLADIVVSDGKATLRPQHLKAAPTGETYVLWQMGNTGSMTQPTALSDVSASKPESVPLSIAYPQTTAFAVSLESVGPLPKEPSKILALASTSN